MLSCDCVFMNKALFDSMPAEYQQIIEECSIAFQNNCVDYQSTYEATAKAALQEKGIGIVELTAEEQAAMDQALQEKVWPYIAEQFGQEFLDGVIKDAGL